MSRYLQAHQGVTLVASRCIYYFPGQFENLLSTQAASITSLILRGNPEKAERHLRPGRKDWLATDALSTLDGMAELAERHNFNVQRAEDVGGDPVVIASKPTA